MLRIHFSDADLGRTKIAAAPDPLWEVAASLHRLQSRRGRWAYAAWYRTARERMQGHGRLGLRGRGHAGHFTEARP